MGCAPAQTDTQHRRQYSIVMMHMMNVCTYRVCLNADTDQIVQMTGGKTIDLVRATVSHNAMSP